MKLTFILISALVFSTLAAAQETTLQSNIVYGHKDGMALYYDVETPPNANGLGIISIVSGGWHSGPENLAISRPFWQVLLDEGYTLFHVYHPSMPLYKVPDSYSAVKLALQHIHANATAFGVNPQRLGITGTSSGGQLALLLAMDEANLPVRVAAVVAFMPPVDLRDSVGNVRSTPALDFDPALAPALSPVDYVSADDPPILLIHGANDTNVPYAENSVRLHTLLDAAGVSNMLVTVQAGHEVFPEPEMAKAHTAMLEWFWQHLQ